MRPDDRSAFCLLNYMKVPLYSMAQ